MKLTLDYSDVRMGKITESTEDVMNIILTGLIALLATLSLQTNAAPVIYKAEADFLLALQALGHPTIFENFENDSVWGASRSTVATPRSTGSVTHKGITWSSNYSGVPYN